MSSRQTYPPSRCASRDLIDETLSNRLTTRIRTSNEFQTHFGELPFAAQADWADRILAATAEYIQFCGESVRQGFAPAELVDLGWHTFILYTREYHAFCSEVVGQFVHHAPNDVPNLDTVAITPDETLAHMRATGVGVDAGVWNFGANSYNCTGGGDSGPAGNCTCS